MKANVKKTRIAELLSTLSKAEIKEFDKKMLSSYSQNSDKYKAWSLAKDQLKKKNFYESTYR